jgi:protein associated with RNAse G/E
MAGETLTVRSLKYDNKVRRTWACELIEKTGALIHCVGVFDVDVSHPGLGDIRRGTISHEYYWTDRWYNIFRFHEPAGSFRNFYCNVAKPVVFTDDVLEYVDLDIDVIVWPDLSYEVHDRDDFEKNSVKYGYPADVMDRAEESLVELTRMIAGRDFPFTTS